MISEEMKGKESKASVTQRNEKRERRVFICKKWFLVISTSCHTSAFYVVVSLIEFDYFRLSFVLSLFSMCRLPHISIIGNNITSAIKRLIDLYWSLRYMRCQLCSPSSIAYKSCSLNPVELCVTPSLIKLILKLWPWLL